MKQYGKSRSTTASPERVWSIWSDPNNWGRWNSGIRSATLDGPLVSGATGSMVTSRGSTHAVTFTDEIAADLRGGRLLTAADAVDYGLVQDLTSAE